MAFALRPATERDYELLWEIQRTALGPCVDATWEGVARLVIEQANAQGLPLRLQVLRSNPARRFYERLGFRLCGETETHFQMCRERSTL